MDIGNLSNEHLNNIDIPFLISAVIEWNSFLFFDECLSIYFMLCYMCITCSVVCLVVIFGVHILIQFYNAPINEFQGKIVLKPSSPEQRWKFTYEPIHQDVRIISKKIPVTKFLNLQVWFDTFHILWILACNGWLVSF